MENPEVRLTDWNTDVKARSPADIPPIVASLSDSNAKKSAAPAASSAPVQKSTSFEFNDSLRNRRCLKKSAATQNPVLPMTISTPTVPTTR